MDKNGLAAFIKPVVEAMGYIYWGSEFSVHRRGASLRVFIDHAGGVTLDDCSAVSDQLSGVLDVEDPVKGPYILEVSSPGVERRLMSAEHYRRYLGSTVSVQSGVAIGGRRNFKGRLAGMEDGVVTLETDDGAVELALASIRRAHLTFEGGVNPKAAR